MRRLWVLVLTIPLVFGVAIAGGCDGTWNQWQQNGCNSPSTNATSSVVNTTTVGQTSNLVRGGVILGPDSAYVRSGEDVMSFNRTGIRWNTSINATGTGAWNSGLIWWGTSDGDLVALNTDGEINKTINISSDPITSQVLMRDGTMWVTSNGTLTRVDQSVNWTVNVTDDVEGIVLDNDSVWVHGDNLTQVRDGTVVQSINTSLGTAPPVSDGDTVFWSTSEGVRSNNWSANTTSKVRASPLVTNDSVYISTQIQMWKINRSTGQVVWNNTAAPEAGQGMMSRGQWVVYGARGDSSGMEGIVYVNKSDGSVVTNGTRAIRGSVAARSDTLWGVTFFGDMIVAEEIPQSTNTTPTNNSTATPTPTPTPDDEQTPIPVGTSPSGPDPLLVFGGMTAVGVVLVILYATRQN